jgi:hypothetical protein
MRRASGLRYSKLACLWVLAVFLVPSVAPMGNLSSSDAFRGFAFALDAHTGEQRWSFSQRQPRCLDIVFATRDRLVVAASDRRRNLLIAYDPRTGDEQWRVPGSAASTAVGAARGHASEAGATVVADDQHGGVHGYATATGELVWQATVAPLEPRGEVFVTAVGKALVLVEADADNFDGGTTQAHTIRLSAIDRSSGRERWQYDLTSGPIVRSISLDRATVALIVNHTDGAANITTTDLVVLDAQTGAVRYTLPVGGNPVIPSALLADSRLIVRDGAGIHGLDPVSGAVLWTNPNQLQLVGATDGLVAGASGSNELVVFDAASGTEQYSLQVRSAIGWFPMRKSVVAWSESDVSAFSDTGERRWHRRTKYYTQSGLRAGDTMYVSGGCNFTD